MLDWLILVAQVQSVWLGYEFFAGLMLTLYQYKPAFQNLLRPLVNRLATWQISPNQVTVSTVLLCGATGLAIAYFPQSQFIFLLLPIVLLGRMALNAIDGMLAREHCLTTHLGCILNELGDVISDVALYLPLSFIPGIAAPPIAIVVILGIITEMVGVLGLAIADSALDFGVIGLVLGLGFKPVHFLTGVWIGVIFLQLWTMVNRIRATLQEVAPCR